MSEAEYFQNPKLKTLYSNAINMIKMLLISILNFLRRESFLNLTNSVFRGPLVTNFEVSDISESFHICMSTEDFMYFYSPPFTSHMQ